MSLIEIWKNSREQIEGKTIQQIISIAGEGALNDGNTASKEFRDFLNHIPSRLLRAYAEKCLTNSFTGSGFGLQDIINQVGRRLGFLVTDGRYKGKSGQIGFDGLWTYEDGYSIIVEVKTTDAYRIDLNKVAQYRQDLSTQGEVDKEKSSILIVVGREDTGDLEAQIRGSRHAWDIRLISVDSLLGLLTLKEDVEDPYTLNLIHKILIPREFTKLDEIIEIVFSTAEDIKGEEYIEDEELGESIRNDVHEDPVSFNDACIKRIEKHLGKSFVKQSPVMFSSPDESFGIVCSVSKEYQRSGKKYWFGFHRHHKDFLEKLEDGLVAFGCGTESNLIVIPYTEFVKWLDGMNITEGERRFYWHVKISQDDDKFLLTRKKGQKIINLTKYLLRVG